MISPILAVLVPLALVLTPAIAPHPHHPKGIIVGGAGGKVTVTYFTVPYNPEQLKKIKPGRSWHLGFAALETEVPLRAGDTDIPAGKYRLNGKLTDAGTWDIQLQSHELFEARGNLRKAQRSARNGSVAAQDRVDELKKVVDALAKKDTGGIAVAAADFKSAEEEHLTMTVINRGYSTVQNGSTEPTGGVEFSLRISFGDLHRTIDIAEVYEAPK